MATSSSTVLAEILTRFPDVDAFSFDGLHYGGVCYCGHCRANYRKDTGAEIPAADMNDPAFRRYQHWADRRMEDLVRRMQQRLKAIKPEVALVTWTTNAGRFGHFLSIPRNMPARMNLLLDAPDQEFWLDETNRGRDHRPGVCQRLHLGDHQPPGRLQRALPDEPRQSLRQGQLPASRGAAADSRTRPSSSRPRAAMASQNRACAAHRCGSPSASYQAGTSCLR